MYIFVYEHDFNIHGHSTGDRTLRTFSPCINTLIQQTDQTLAVNCHLHRQKEVLCTIDLAGG